MAESQIIVLRFFQSFRFDTRLEDAFCLARLAARLRDSCEAVYILYESLTAPFISNSALIIRLQDGRVISCLVRMEIA